MELIPRNCWLVGGSDIDGYPFEYLFRNKEKAKVMLKELEVDEYTWHAYLEPHTIKFEDEK